MPRFEINLISITIGDHVVTPPEGLSELLNKGNAWSERTEVKNDYKREVIKKNGRIHTILTKVNSD